MTKIPLKKIMSDDDLAARADFFSSSITDDWFKKSEEGQLAVDVYQTKDEIIVKAPIAGVKPEDLDISIHNDMLTIRGVRAHNDEVEDDHYFYRECYWGTFSRSIILPTDVKTERVDATLKNGILMIKLPKANKSRLIKVKGLDED